MQTLAQLNFDQLEQASVPAFDGETPADVIMDALVWVFIIAGFLLLIYLLSGGFQLMLSRGDPKAVEMGKAKIGNALLGFLVILVSFFLVQLIAEVLGIQSIIDIFPQ